MTDFTLHPQLDKDSFYLGHLDLSQVRLVNNRLFPWVILVPEVADASDIYLLDTCLQAQLWRESRNLSKALMSLFNGDKLNVACIGNQVPQLHLHHVVRFKEDALWPQAVWQDYPAEAYSETELNHRANQIKQALEIHGLAQEL